MFFFGGGFIGSVITVKETTLANPNATFVNPAFRSHHFSFRNKHTLLNRKSEKRSGNLHVTNIFGGVTVCFAVTREANAVAFKSASAGPFHLFDYPTATSVLLIAPFALRLIHMFGAE